MRKRRNLPSSSSSSGSKKLEFSRVYKLEGHENEDIISNLPEHILHYIFNFLDMKQAIQTCILSKRWRNFWVSLPTLNFSCLKGRRKTTRNEFMTFVDRVLMFRGNSNIHAFVLVTGDCIDLTDRLNTWILASVIRNAQEITLDTYFPGKFHFHHCLFTCKSLTKLVVRATSERVSNSLPDSITLPRLKTLCLDSVTFEDEHLTNKLFSSCPVLESLIIKSCLFLHININISSPQLQHLVVENCRTKSAYMELDPVDIEFKLCTPNLISFHCDSEMLRRCAPKNLCSLVKADIYLHCYREKDVYISRVDPKWSKAMYAPYMVNILRELHNVEDLTLSASFLEVVTGAPDLLDSQPPKFCNLRCLKLAHTCCSIDSIHSISYLLKISPNIETLSVKVCYFGYETMHPYWDEITSNSANRGDYLEALLSLVCLLNHLKCFELRNVTGRVNELEFIEILLKNALLLEKLLIVFQKSYSFGKEIDLVERRLVEQRQVKFSEKVLTFPRASSSVVIMFKPDK